MWKFETIKGKKTEVANWPTRVPKEDGLAVYAFIEAVALLLVLSSETAVVLVEVPPLLAVLLRKRLKAP